MKSSVLLISAVLGILALTAGCEESSRRPYGSGHDFGNNDPDTYLCFGDSLTAGFGEVTPYPRHLADILIKRVINQGIPGERARNGLARLGGVLDVHKPGHVLILHGVNDIIHGGNPDHIAEQIRGMIRVARVRNVLPAVSTITPFVGNREGFNGAVDLANERIRSVASQEGVLLVDCHQVINGRPDYVLADGLHYSEVGSMAVAAAWSDRL